MLNYSSGAATGMNNPFIRNNGMEIAGRQEAANSVADLLAEINMDIEKGVIVIHNENNMEFEV